MRQQIQGFPRDAAILASRRWVAASLWVSTPRAIFVVHCLWQKGTRGLLPDEPSRFLRLC